MARLLLALLVALVVAAKAPTVKITILGGALKKTIEVADPRVRELGFGAFDASRPPLQDVPQRNLFYEVSFFSEFELHSVRKNYVAYYYPGSSGEEGLIYLPGKGAVRELNIGTIYSPERDGKWSYVLPQWERLIKPIIVHAEAEGAESGRFQPQVAIEGWTAPRPGWLYALDPQADADRAGSRVLLVDPRLGKVMGSIRAGEQPDMALGPDGRRLYIVCGERESGELAVIDTANGKVRHFPFPDRVLYRPWYAHLPPYSLMALSSDGGLLRILEPHVVSPDQPATRIVSFDTRTEQFLKASVQAENCGGVNDFVVSSTASQFRYFCSGTNTLMGVKLPGPWRCQAAAVFALRGRDKVAIVRRDGEFEEMDFRTHEFSPLAPGADCREWVVFPFVWPLSADSRSVFIGFGPPTPNGLATSSEIRVFDLESWQRIGTIRTSVPFWSVAPGGDGKVIYAFAPEQHEVLVIDTADGAEKRRFAVGRMAAAGVVAP